MPGDTQFETDWVPLKLSAIEYPQDDIIGKFMALVSLSALLLFASFISLMVFRRDLHTITLFIGMLVNEVLCSTLKHIIAQPRPSFRDSDKLFSEYGMPSSHSQAIWFFSTYMFYFIFIRTHYAKTDFVMYLWKTLTVLALFTWAILMAISRVYLRYHTVEQVVCGAILGSIFSTIWFVFTQHVLTPIFPAIAAWRISELLLIRDTTLIPNILWFEYTSAQQEVRTRRRKSISKIS